MKTTHSCPCGSGRQFSECCGCLLAGEASAATAETLMRSRYTAYLKKDIEYLLDTWHSSTQPPHIDPQTIPGWYNLEILAVTGGSASDKEGTVEFKASCHIDGKPVTLHEKSRFVSENGRWLYLDGTIVNEPQKIKKIGRNDPCSCGSGKKYKKCCLKKLAD